MPEKETIMMSRTITLGLLGAATILVITPPVEARQWQRQPPARVLKLHRTNLRPGYKAFSMGSGMALADARSRAVVYTPNGSGGYQYHDSLTGQRLVHVGGAPGVFYPAQDRSPSSPSAAPAAAPAGAQPAQETAEQTTARLNQIMQEMQHAGYSNLQIVGNGASAAVRGVKESPGARIESTICRPGMCQ
jgi:hypothetical protein